MRDRVSRVMGRLPDEADPPRIQKVDSGADPVLFVILSSSQRNGLELSDYAARYLVDRLGAVPGVASVCRSTASDAIRCASGSIAARWRRGA